VLSALSRRPFQAVFCRFDRHDPDRDNVHWEGAHYAGICRACQAPIRRHAHRVWKRIPGEQ